jgi:hypothetical protein
MSEASPTNALVMAYQQLCTSYHNIDDFRAKLLALLPIAAGGGIFLLLSKETDIASLAKYLLPIAVYGALVTLGLFAYEIYGISKCTELILTGIQLEGSLRVDGQFTRRPPGVLGFINEPFAAGIIYPALLAAWMFLGCVFTLGMWAAGASAVGVFGLGFLASFRWNSELGTQAKIVADLSGLNQRMLQAEEAGDAGALASCLDSEFTIVRANGERQDRRAFLEDVPHKAHRGRTATQWVVRLYGECAVFSCCVETLSRDTNGGEVADHFWNARLFRRRGEDWRCAAWQVMRIS